MRIGSTRSWSAAALILLAGCGSGSSGGSSGGQNTQTGGGTPSSDSGTPSQDGARGGGGSSGSSGRGGSSGTIGTIDSSILCPSTCAELGANCGSVTDRNCGDIVQCGSCAAGQFCGGAGPNVCGTGTSSADAGDGGGTCVPRTCQQRGANCGFVSDGCGALIQCGSCEAGAGCGVGGTPNVCAVSSGDGGGTCTPRSCATQGLSCGPAGDGCGNALNCGTCTGSATCGGAGTPGMCGTASCTPSLTCVSQGIACGPAGDGCGNTLSCGTCGSPRTCGGGGTPGQCGCTGLCSQVPTCPGSTTTTITGKVYDPAGNNPLYHALVYVPNEPNDPALLSFPAGITCDQCGASAAGKPLVTTYSGTDGSFTLSNVPVGSNIPLVIQLGRWRRKFAINVANSCAANALPAGTLKMPSDRTEGDIPAIAMVTGNVDEIECVFRKMGIKDSEFTNPPMLPDGGVTTGGGRIHFYKGTDSTGLMESGGGNSTHWSGQYINGSTPTQAELFKTVNGVPVINQYDMTILACEGAALTRSASELTSLRNYANGGGRVYASHFSYSWLEPSANYSSTAQWAHDTNDQPASATGIVDLVSNPKGADFLAWLQAVNASPGTGPAGTVPVLVIRHDANAVISPTQQWLYRERATEGGMVNVPLHFTFNTPPSAPSASQCGRVLFSDFHVHDANSNWNNQFPSACDNNPMNAQEKLLEFMIFDLGSCVTPYTPVCTPITCGAQNIQCGPAGDGCGNLLACGTCPAGQFCGGGGAGRCGAPQCAPRTCAQQGIQCGPAGDGCGNALTCPACPPGQTCGGGGTPGMCGNGGGGCTPLTCAAQGIECGPAGDGCGDAITCPPCAAGQTCGGGGPGKCGAPQCSALTCAVQGIECGPAGDGCGNLLDCGPCPAGDTCGYNAPGKCGHLILN